MSTKEAMDRTNRVSVVLSVLNCERFVAEAIESVFAQTFKSWELLLVDDGSTDGTTRIIRAYAEKYPGIVRYLEHDGHRNRGLPASRNVGIGAAAGEYIALLDADDVWLPEKLEGQVAILDSHPEIDLVYGSNLYWHSWSDAAQPDTRMIPGIPTDCVYTPPDLLRLTLSGRACSPCPSDLIFRKASIGNLGGFEASFHAIDSLYEDQSFLVKVYAELPVYVSSECWDYYRVHPDQLCARMMREGRKGHAEHFFLSWAREYLLQRGQLDAELASVFRRRMWPYEHPFLARLQRFGQRVALKSKPGAS